MVCAPDFIKMPTTENLVLGAAKVYIVSQDGGLLLKLCCYLLAGVSLAQSSVICGSD